MNIQGEFFITQLKTTTSAKPNIYLQQMLKVTAIYTFTQTNTFN